MTTGGFYAVLLREIASTGDHADIAVGGDITADVLAEILTGDGGDVAGTGRDRVVHGDVRTEVDAGHHSGLIEHEHITGAIGGDAVVDGDVTDIDQHDGAAVGGDETGEWAGVKLSERIVIVYALHHDIVHRADDNVATVYDIDAAGGGQGGKGADTGFERVVGAIAEGADAAVGRDELGARGDNFRQAVAAVQNRTEGSLDMDARLGGDHTAEDHILAGEHADVLFTGNHQPSVAHNNRSVKRLDIDGAGTTTDYAGIDIHRAGGQQGDRGISGIDRVVDDQAAIAAVGAEAQVVGAQGTDQTIHGDVAENGVNQQTAIAGDQAVEGRQVGRKKDAVRQNEVHADRADLGDFEIIVLQNVHPTVQRRAGEGVDIGINAVGDQTDVAVYRHREEAIANDIGKDIAVIEDITIDRNCGNAAGARLEAGEVDVGAGRVGDVTAGGGGLHAVHLNQITCQCHRGNIASAGQHIAVFVLDDIRAREQCDVTGTGTDIGVGNDIYRGKGQRTDDAGGGGDDDIAGAVGGDEAVDRHRAEIHQTD